MKIKTSITISEELLKKIDNIDSKKHNRSAIIEKALWFYLEIKTRNFRDQKDLDILNKISETHLKENEEIMDMQADL